MRKLFTSVVAALCLAAPMSTLSAQNTQQLTEAQKEAIKKEVLPVVFEQIKEQAGIDILGWANPSLSNTFAGIPVLESSNLRAASAESVSVRPDRIALSTNKIVSLLPDGLIPSDLQPIIDAVLGDTVNVTFADYDVKTLPISLGQTPITVDLPATINIAGNMPLANVYFESTTDSANGTLLDLNVDMEVTLTGGGERSDLVSCTLTMSQAMELNANVDVQDGLRSLLTMLSVPAVDYLVTVNLSGLMTTGTIPASLFAIPEGGASTARVSMGDAVVYLNQAPTALFPITKINVTGYSNEGAANAWSIFNFNMNETTSEVAVAKVLSVDKYIAESSTMADSTFKQRTIITMTDNTPSIPTTPEAAVKSVVNRVVSELAEEGKATWYELNIEQIDDNLTNAVKQVLNIEVQPYFEDETTAIADVIITPANGSEYVIKATADLTNNKIAVQVADYGTAYFTSNIAGVITANESVEESVATMKVVPTQNAIRVTNVDKGTYRIVSMTGAVVASGHINGDTYIPTASLAQGIYIVAVEANGTLQSVKVKL